MKKLKKLSCILSFILLLGIISVAPAAAAGNTAEQNPVQIHTSFKNLIPGQAYSFIVFRDINADDPLADDNLIYIEQANADNEGCLSFTYLLRDSDRGVAKIYGPSAEWAAELTWSITDAGCMSISGSGTIEDYSASSKAPWYSQRGDITEIVIADNFEKIGSYAFVGCNKLKSVTVPDSVSEIGDCAFGYSDEQGTKLADFTIYGDNSTAAQAYAIANCFDYVSIEIVLGDVNCDGEVTLADAIRLQKAVLAMTNLTEAELKNADVNGDGNVNLHDAILTQKLAVKTSV